MLELFPKNERAWKRQLIVVLFGLFSVGQLCWLVMPKISTGHPSPRMRQAMESHEMDSPSVQMGAMSEASRLDMIDYQRRETAKYAVILGMDMAVIYLFWKYGKRYTVA